jgi:hypothetical protein
MFSPPIITATPNAGYRSANSERHYCRNPRCRLKLPEPVSNKREAFCCRGCHQSYFLKRCLVCENPKPGMDWKFCRRPRCRSKYYGNPGFYDWPTRQMGPSASLTISNPKSAHSTGLKSSRLGDRARPWRIVAGRELTPTQLHCAILPPDPQLVARLTRQHKQYYCDTAKSLIGPTDLPINKIPGLTRPRSPIDRAALSALPLPADLTIPDFLRRARATP